MTKQSLPYPYPPMSTTSAAAAATNLIDGSSGDDSGLLLLSPRFSSPSLSARSAYARTQPQSISISMDTTVAANDNDNDNAIIGGALPGGDGRPGVGMYQGQNLKSFAPALRRQASINMSSSLKKSSLLSNNSIATGVNSTSAGMLPTSVKRTFPASS